MGPLESPYQSKRLQILVFAGMAAFALVFGLSGSQSLLHGQLGHPLALRIADGVFGGLGLVAMWWRRRFPMAFAIYVAVVGAFSTLAGGLGTIAAFTVAIHRTWPSAVMASTLIVGLAWPSFVLYADADRRGPLVLWAIALIFGVMGWGMFIRARRQLVATLRSRADRAEASREQHAELARIAERQRIAREMHDVLAHRLSLLSVQAGALELATDATAASPDELAQAAQAIRTTTHQALHELRAVVQVLRAADDDDTAAPQPVAADLPALIGEAGTAATIHFTTEVELDAVPTDTGRTMYRIVQEGLTNARKHAPASSVEVELGGDPAAGLTLALTSWLPVDRPGGPPGSGTGLIGLRERVVLAGGRLDVAVTADDRFQLSAWLPWSR